MSELTRLQAENKSSLVGNFNKLDKEKKAQTSVCEKSYESEENHLQV